MTGKGPRRVVTGVDAGGRSVFLRDEDTAIDGLSHFPDGCGVVKLWGSNQRPRVPASSADLEYDPVFPPPSGFRYDMFYVMPDSARAEMVVPEPAQMAAEMDATFPGLREHMGPDGMHATHSVDIGVVLKGEIVLELDDGAETVLRAGDTFVQQGTNHAWRNRSDEIVAMAIVVIGAEGLGSR